MEVIDPERSTARHPLFQVMLAFQNLDIDSLELPDLTVSALDTDAAVAKFDLQVTVSDDAADGYLVDLTYATDLFDASTITAFSDRLVRVLEAVVADPAVRSVISICSMVMSALWCWSGGTTLGVRSSRR